MLDELFDTLIIKYLESGGTLRNGSLFFHKKTSYREGAIAERASERERERERERENVYECVPQSLLVRRR
jgi:hypothetical protein